MQSLKAGIIAGIFVFSFSPAVPVIWIAQAIDWTSFAGAGIQYIALEKEIKYLDNDGRNEFFEQMKKKYGVNDDPTPSDTGQKCGPPQPAKRVSPPRPPEFRQSDRCGPRPR